MKLANKTLEELIAIEKALCEDPGNKAPPGELNLYTPKARKKMAKVREEIADRIKQKRIARGDIINTSGYSGRKQNRRR